MADWFFALVAMLAAGGTAVNLYYAIRHWRRERWLIRLIQAFVCGYVVVVMVLDAGNITDMTGISGYLLLLGLALVLAASLSEGIIDL